jgi:hypothetical protein
VIGQDAVRQFAGPFNGFLIAKLDDAFFLHHFLHIAVTFDPVGNS